MTFNDALRQAADPAMKTPRPAIPSSHEPSIATQPQNPFEGPKSKTKSSTHLCITIRLGGAASPSYLPVASGGAGAARAAVRGGEALC